MSDTVYAAVLGLIIPVLGVSVCSRLWRQGSAALRGRKSKKEIQDGLLTIGFAIRVSTLLGACYAFHRVASSMKLEPEHFDPYLILELPSRGANSTLIKSQYRKLSLKHHPDKNRGNSRAASAQFNKVAKAYQALSDPHARRNWEKYGHPDGHQSWTFDLALPAWLTPSKDTDNATMVLYAVGYLAVLVGFVLSVKIGLDLLDPAGGPKQPMFEVNEEDVQALLKNLDDTSSTEDVLECLAACPQLCTEDRRALAVAMEPTTKPILERLLARGAAALRAPPAPRSDTPGKSARSGKGKSKGKGGSKGNSSGGGASGSGSGGGGEVRDSRNVEGGAEQTEDIAEEFFSKGRRGEGNRRTTRSLPELSQVVTHNLVVLLSALYREDITAAAVPENSVDKSGAVPSMERAVGEIPEIDAVDTTKVEGEALSDGKVVDPSNACVDEKPSDGLASLSVTEASAKLADEQEAVFGLAEPLLDACLKVAAHRASPRLFGTVVEAKAMLRRRLWSSDDPDAISEQARAVDVDLDAAVPRVKVENVVVETWGESQIALGDTVTATITVSREHSSEYKGFRRRRPVEGFLARGEPWWIILSGGREGETLIGVTPMLVENLGSDLAECKVKFQAPRRPCMMSLTVAVKSPVFVGVDCEGSTTFRVYRHDELKEDKDAGDW